MGSIPDDYLSTKDAARLLGVHAWTLKRWARANLVESIPISTRSYCFSEAALRKQFSLPGDLTLSEVLYTPSEVAEICHTTHKAVGRWAREGKLVCIQLIGARRYRERDVRAFLDSRKK